MSDITHRTIDTNGKQFLFSDRGEVDLRGFDEPVRLYEVRWQEQRRHRALRGSPQRAGVADNLPMNSPARGDTSGTYRRQVTDYELKRYLPTL